MSEPSWWKMSLTAFTLFIGGAIVLHAQTFSLLHTFDFTNGYSPNALVQAADGNLYGTTSNGGTNTCIINGLNFGCGTVFRMSPTGALNTLYNFCSQSGCADGEGPGAPLIQATDGSLYGVTTGSASAQPNIAGTVFRVTLRGELTTLYHFCSLTGCADGELPYAPLVQATDGNFYGTTGYGGAHIWGTVFKITPSGKLTTLYSFCSESHCTDGQLPFAGVVQGVDGNLYGTTNFGGSYGYGTVFRITTGGKLTTLHSFDNTDGAEPQAGLVQAPDGYFYGTSEAGGINGQGTVFRITANGTLTVLYSFCSQSNCTDGADPHAGLVLGSDGNFYGEASGGGESNSGTIFKITPDGVLATLYSFCSQSGCSDGADPWNLLVQATDGSFYSTTILGGASSACSDLFAGESGCGTAFGFSVGLGPFVETEPAGGKVGASIKILGTDLMGATSVTFNGTPATFTVEASSVINATVPAGATTGTVQVVTPSGTLSSNVPFRVAP
jgi:uncharacterized repeat protein (TIGR03803 family)